MPKEYEDSSPLPNEQNSWNIDNDRRCANNLRRRNLLIISLCSILVGLIILLMTVFNQAKISDNRWHLVRAIITQTIVQPTLVTEKNGFTLYSGSSEYREFLPVLAITYTADGVSHQSKCPVGAPTFLKDEAKADLDKFRAGQEISVYYDSTMPGQTSLSPKMENPASSGLGFFGFLTLCLGGILLLAWVLNGVYVPPASMVNVDMILGNKPLANGNAPLVKDSFAIDTNAQKLDLISPLLDTKDEIEHIPKASISNKSRRISNLSVIITVIAIASVSWAVYKIKSELDQFWLANQALSWPTTEGSVLSAKIYKYNTHYYDKSELTTVTFSTFKPTIIYSYKVQNREFTSSQYSLATQANSLNCNDDSVAKAIVRQYQPGRKIIIYYNPKDPNMAVIQPGYEPESFDFGSRETFMTIVLALWLPTCLAINCCLTDLSPTYAKLAGGSSAFFLSGSQIILGFVGMVLPILFITIFLSQVVPKFLPGHGIIHLGLRQAQDVGKNLPTKD